MRLPIRSAFLAAGLLPALLLSQSTTTNTIHGRVLDPSGRSIAGATVSCNGQTATSNAQGEFEIKQAGTCEGRVTKEGFETRTVQLPSGGGIRLELAHRNERAVVTATRVPTLVEEAGASASVLTADEIAARQYPALIDLIRDLPGAAVVQSGRMGAVTSFFTRGSASTGTLVLLDGEPLNDPGSPIDAAHLTTPGIDRVEMVRGPQSVLFGAEASAAVIQMFSKQGDPEARWPHGELSYERGSFQTDRWIASLGGGLFAGRMDYSLTAAQLHTAGEYQNDYYRNSSGTANIGFRLTDQTTARAVFRTYDTALGTPGQIGYGIYDFNARNNSRDSAVDVRVEDTRGRFYQRAAFGYHRNGLLSESDKAYGPYPIAAIVEDVATPFQQVRLVELVSPATPASAVPTGDRLVKATGYTYPGTSYFFSDRKDFDYQGNYADPGGVLAFGYRFEQQEGIVTGLTPSRTNNGLYAHRQQRVGKRLVLTAGGRWERSSAFGNRFTPRASASYRVWTDTWLRVSGGLGITEPQLLQNFAVNPYYVGNRSLRPEKTANFEASVLREFLNGRLRAEATMFRNAFHDLITYVSLYPQPGTWQNINQSWARGVELSLSGKVWRWVSVNAAYTHTHTRIVTAASVFSLTDQIGQPLVRRPPNAGSVSAMATPGKKLTVTGGVQFVGERTDTGSPFGVTINPGYQRMFFAASYRAAKHWQPFVRIDNALDQRYQEALGYPALGRFATGGMRVNW